jgi:hypothetical protein
MTQETMTLRGKLLAGLAGSIISGFAATASAHGLAASSGTAAAGQTLQGVQVAVSGGPYSHAAAHPERYQRHLRQWYHYQQLWRYYQPVREQPVRALGALDGRPSV